MTIVSKLIPVLRNGNSNLITAIVHTSKFRSIRYVSTKKTEGAVAKSKEKAEISADVRPIGEKIKETTKTISYTGVILVGVGVTGFIFFYVFRELFSSNSPNSIYSVALEKCRNNPQVEDALGAPIKGFGEETTRRRRTHVSHVVYEKNGIKHMRMRFYIKGFRNKAVVELDMKQNMYGNYQCRYLLVQLEDYSGKTFVIEDNRKELDQTEQINQLPMLNLSQ